MIQPLFACLKCCRTLTIHPIQYHHYHFSFCDVDDIGLRFTYS